MKEIKSYECDYCHDKYATEEECRECEEKHTTPVRVYGSEWAPRHKGGGNYPRVVEVEMSNGEKVSYYKLCSFCGRGL